MVSGTGVAAAGRPRSLPEHEHVVLPARLLYSGDRRLDGETYLMPGFLYRYELEASADAVPLSELAEVWQPSRLKGVKVRPDHGIPFLTATQVFDIRPRPRKWISPSKTPGLDERYVKPGWILVTCSGSVGDCILTYTPHSDLVVSHDLLRVQPHDASLTGYLYAYLRTRYGRAIMRATRYGNIIKHLEPEHLNEIPVPRVGHSGLPNQLLAEVAEVFKWRDQAYHLEREAEDWFESETGLSAAGSMDEPIHLHASEMFTRGRRLDAYHYNRVAHSILESIAKQGHRVDLVREVTHDVILPQRFARGAYVQNGVPYVDSEDIFKINPEVDKFLSYKVADHRKGYYVKRGWVLMARSGQIYGLNGSVVLADGWHENKVLSEHIIRIVPDSDHIRPGYLCAALGHPTLGRPLVLRCAFGTSVPEISPEDVGTLPVVRLPQSAEDGIADMFERASELRMKADRMENDAVWKLELEIASALDRNRKVAEPT